MMKIRKVVFTIVLLALLTACADKSPVQESVSGDETTADIALDGALQSGEPENTESEPAPGIDGIVWIVPPTFLYDDFIYCPAHDSFMSSGGLFIDEKTGEETDESCAHGVSWTYFLYDEQNDIFGAYISSDGDPSFKFYTKAEFESEFSDRMNNVNPFFSIDSTKFVQLTHTYIDTDGEEIPYYEYVVEDGGFTGNAAIAYGIDFVSDFIYDDTEIWRRFNNIIAVSVDDKWGILNDRGEVVAPFIFDHAISIDDSTAFVKYERRYGIISVH